jgi:hypothetical protein
MTDFRDNHPFLREGRMLHIICING